MHITTAFIAAVEASTAIMDIYNGTVSASYKSDGSPVTEADKLADATIREHLKSTGIPVISEESALMPYEKRKPWSTVWMVDPLDGTKEFLKRNGEFTVNIALIENGHPIMGIITAPYSGKGWIGVPGSGIHMIENIYDKDLQLNNEQVFNKLTTHLPDKAVAANKSIRLAVSRSHPDDHTKDMIKYLKELGYHVRSVARGSSLKLCEIAAGHADVYTRFGPTKEWDIAAGHAILLASGGNVIDFKTDKPLTYNKPDMLNPYFLAYGADLSKGLLSSIKSRQLNP